MMEVPTNVVGMNNEERNGESNGHSSPDSGVAMTDTGDKPASGTENQTEPHIVHVIVEAGEVFSVRMGDSVRPIIGPATIRMVSTSGPPTAMQMRAPQGHVVQQIVDENNVLTHVLLRTQPPPPGHMGQPGPGFHYGNSSPRGGHLPGAGGYSYNGAPPPGAPFSQNYRPPSYHHHPLQGGIHPGQPMNTVRSGTQTCNNHGRGPDERTLRKKQQLREKANSQYNNPQGEPTILPVRQPVYGALPPRMNGNGSSPRSHDMYSCSSSTDSHDTAEEERRQLQEALSTILPPQITSVEAKKAVVQIQPPSIPEGLTMDQSSEIQFDLQYCDRNKDGKYKPLYTGDANQITMKDLKPATEYFVKVTAMIEDVRGQYTDPVMFRTEACSPEAPAPPRLFNRSKNSITLKWLSGGENGAKIQAFSLEYSEGTHEPTPFTECYYGPVKQFKVSPLNASHCYTFRLAAINGHGKSEFSDITTVWTPGSAPPAPDAPRLSDCLMDSLLLTWIKRPIDKEFKLQKEEEDSEHGFLAAYTGPEVSYKVTKLEKSKSYKFRLCSSNEDGTSVWSEVVEYKTQAGLPSAPSKPVVKGKITSKEFRLTWGEPREDGGAQVQVYLAELDGGDGYQKVYEGAALECSCTNLLPGFTYRARIAGRNAAGQGHWSEAASVTTKPVPPKACSQPFLHGKPKAHFLHLKWSAPTDTGGAPIQLYCVQLICMDNTSREVYRGPDTECKVAGLAPGRSYLLQVRAINEAGEGEWSELLDVLSGAGVPEAPVLQQCQCKTSAHSVTVEWRAPCNNGAKISEYRLEWLKPGTQEFTQLYIGPGISSRSGDPEDKNLLSHEESKGLKPASDYSFRVQAINSSGASAFSEVVTVTTSASSPSTVHLVRTSCTATTMNISWQEPDSNGSPVTQYKVEYGKSMSSKNLYVMVSEDETECMIEDLEPDITYRVRVQAVNSIGVGPYCAQHKAVTKSLPPVAPLLECTISTYNTVKLRWKEHEKADLFTVNMLRGDHSSQGVQVYHGKALQCKVGKLQENTEYQFTLSAQNSAGIGLPSERLVVLTSKAPPHSIKAPTISDTSKNSCKVHWQSTKPFLGDSIEYRLQMCHSQGQEFKQVYHGTETSFHMNELLPGHTYTMRVCPLRVSTSEQGDRWEIAGAYSQGTSFTTVKPEPVSIASHATLKEDIGLRNCVISLLSKLRPETDQQFAMAILIGIFLLSVVVAIFAHYMIV